jgi:hypothetical protein
MKTLTRARMCSSRNLAALLMVMALGVAVSPAFASAAAPAAQTPTLTNDVGQPAGHAEPQAALGIALLILGAIGLAAGAAQLARRRVEQRTA